MALLALAVACLWMAWTASRGIQGAYFTDDTSAPYRAGYSHTDITATVVLWVIAAAVSAVTAAAIARRAHRR